MREIQIFSLLGIAVFAVLSDLKSGRIPNGLVAAAMGCGMVYQTVLNGAGGVLIYLGGILVPILLFGGFYYFRMIGAGDVKLMSAVGGFLGPSECIDCIAASIIIAAVFSITQMLRKNSLEKRLMYLYKYSISYTRDRKWKPYLAGTTEQDRFSFSLPILLGILYQIVKGGMV